MGWIKIAPGLKNGRKLAEDSLTGVIDDKISITPFFFIRVTTNTGLASIRAWMSVMDLEIWYYVTVEGAECGIPSNEEPSLLVDSNYN